MAEKPKFRVEVQPFFDGAVLHPVGEEIVWDAPDEWDSAKNGRHHMTHYPPVTFVPLNKPAEDLKAELEKMIRKNNEPKPTQDDETRARFAKMEQMHIEAMNAIGLLAAEMRRQSEAAAERAEAEEKAGKRK